jgi:RNA polymerase sigma-70 factor (ECF subfamily)
LNNVADHLVNKLELRRVGRAANGDREARRELFELHRDAAYCVAARLVGNEADALDVVQDAFIKAFEGLSSFRHGASFKTWLLRIVNNTGLDHLRARNIRKALPLDDEEGAAPAEPLAQRRGDRPVETLKDRELTDRVKEAIAMLPPAQRSVFALYLGGDLTYGQIAEIAGIPIGTVMSRIYHSRRQLQEMLPDLAPAEESRRKR